MRCIVTRPQAQAEALVATLCAAGVDAVALPLIDIAPPADARPLRQAWQGLARRAWVMFVSANAVGGFFMHRPAGEAWPRAVRAGATGPGTVAALHAAGVPADVIDAPADAPFDSEALWRRLRGRDWAGQQVLVVRGEGGRDWLAQQLRAAGASVDFVAAYARRAPALGAPARALLAQALAQPGQHLWLFSSAEAVGHLGALAPQAEWSAAAALASHPRIEAAARRLGFGRVAPAAVPAAALLAQLRSLQSAAP